MADTEYKNPGPLNQKQLNRFHSHIDKSGGVDACHPWTKSTARGGYGQFVYGRNGARLWIMAHRLVLFLSTGTMGEVAMHACDNPPCCNPRHLKWGNRADNNADMRSKGRHATGDRSGVRKHRDSYTYKKMGIALSLSQREEITRRFIPSINTAILAAEYGVSSSTIRRIIARARRNV